jgi:CheY-like chemotaxis protein
MTEHGSDAATILLVADDDSTRPVLTRSLHAWGYRVLRAFDEQDALERTQGGRERADLILVNLVRVPLEEALSAALRIRTNAQQGRETPIVLMPGDFGDELAGQQSYRGNNACVLYLEDTEELSWLMTRLLAARAPAPAARAV